MPRAAPRGRLPAAPAGQTQRQDNGNGHGRGRARLRQAAAAPQPGARPPAVEEEDHPLPREWVEALVKAAEGNGVRLDWVNCGLCVDERGVAEAVAGTRRGSPGDFWKMASESDNTLVIPTK